MNALLSCHHGQCGGVSGSDVGQLVARAQGAGPRQERAQVRKGETTGAYGVVVRHGGSVLKLGCGVWTPFAHFNPHAERYLLNSLL